MAKPVVAIVGRPNVGKSTLFNKLIGKRLSIVDDTPGVTRDRIYGDCEWLGHEMLLIDTGGIEPKTNDIILSQMRRQAQLAIDSADVIILVTDLKSGVVATDEEVAAMLQKSGKPIILCVNKCDKVGETPLEYYEFYNLGLGEPIAVSSVHGHGTGDLLDEVLKYLPEDLEEETDDNLISVAVIGKPNVGKSSLINKLAQEDRVIVSDIAGTTRDVVEESVRLGDIVLRLSDTAGIHETGDVVESVGVEKALKKLETADLILAVFDMGAEITAEDRELAEKCRGKNAVAILNKSDLEQRFDLSAISDNFSEIVTISAGQGEGLDRLKTAIENIYKLANINSDMGILANERQRGCAVKAKASFEEALGALRAGATYDAVNILIDDGENYLLELTGERASEAVVNEVFSRFCVGK